MEWVLLGVALALLLGLLVVRQHGAGRSSRPLATGEVDDLFSGADDDLQSRLETAYQEAGHSKEVLVSAQLDLIRDRQVPLRSVRPAPSEHTARLRFANGTTVIARAARPGQIYQLAMALQRHHVTLRSWTLQGESMALVLQWPPDGTADLIAEGLDQAD